MKRERRGGGGEKTMTKSNDKCQKTKELATYKPQIGENILSLGVSVVREGIGDGGDYQFSPGSTNGRKQQGTGGGGAMGVGRENKSQPDSGNLEPTRMWGGECKIA